MGVSRGAFFVGGVIGFGEEGVGVVEFTVIAKGVFGIPHICDSVVLTKASFGLLGSHIFAFSAGETVVLVGNGEVGDGVT
jgi:hypothetical protein